MTQKTSFDLRFSSFLISAIPSLNPQQVQAIFEGNTSAASQLPQDPSLTLILIDPIGIQDLVFLSHRLITTRGASVKLGKWDEQLPSIIPEQYPHIILFHGGGQALLLCTNEHAQTITTHIEDAFYDTFSWPLISETLRVSAHDLCTGGHAIPDFSPADLAILGWKPTASGFGALIAKLAYKLQRSKDNHTQWRYPAHNTTRCWESGFLPASTNRQKAGRSDICFALRQSDPQNIDESTEADTNKDLSYKNTAYLYLDGTNIGQHLQQRASIKEYHSFSQTLIRAFGREATKERLKKLGLHENDYVLAVCGGDDFQIAFDATLYHDRWKGPLELLTRIIQDIHEELDKEWASENIGVGAGIAIGSGLNAPFGFRMARLLCDNAKDLEIEHRSSIDFEVLAGGSVVADSINKLREDKERDWLLPLPVKNRPARGTFVLGNKPYSFEKMQELVDLSAEIETISVGKGVFYRIRTLMEDDPLVGILNATYLMSRLSGTEDLVIPKEQWGTNLENTNSILIQKTQKDNTWCTIVPDIVEAISLREKANQGRRQ